MKINSYNIAICITMPVKNFNGRNSKLYDKTGRINFREFCLHNKDVNTH